MALNTLNKESYRIDYRDNAAEGLFKAIVILEQEEDTEKIVEKLKKRLEKDLSTAVMPKGRVYRKLGDIIYYPNGIVEVLGYRTLLSGYEYELPETKKVVKKQRPTDYHEIKRLSMIWYWQIRHSLGKKYTLPSSYDLKKYQKSMVFAKGHMRLEKEVQEITQYDFTSSVSFIATFLKDIIPSEFTAKTHRSWSSRSATGWGLEYELYYIRKYTGKDCYLSYLTETEIEEILSIYEHSPSEDVLWKSLLTFSEEKYSNPDDEGFVHSYQRNIDHESRYTYKQVEYRFATEALEKITEGPVYDILYKLGIIFDGMFDKEEAVE